VSPDIPFRPYIPVWGKGTPLLLSQTMIWKGRIIEKLAALEDHSSSWRSLRFARQFLAREKRASYLLFKRDLFLLLKGWGSPLSSGEELDKRGGKVKLGHRRPASATRTKQKACARVGGWVIKGGNLMEVHRGHVEKGETTFCNRRGQARKLGRPSDKQKKRALRAIEEVESCRGVAGFPEEGMTKCGPKGE